ncbi:hypothetical protein IC582_029413 [Cucumis melo]|uniref:Uncharacterized protein LOC103486076 isoform X1 n=1 Tax=Cucumis melo TaxID=3656 RepID=A0A1S3B4Z1_CUCME|nr:uncharacterized protein LOC103486076 isoform X1 [Cucumis melo]
MGAEALKRWDTWQELLLGGAIVRHGTGDWNLVATELRSRIARPYLCTPEVCKAKYEDLKKRFVGCKAWYEELRQKRIMELRQALEHSEDSIGSLESKLEALKSRSGSDKSLVNGSTRSESWGAVQKPTNEQSASSFTQENRTTCSSIECQPAPLLTEETEIKPEPLQSLEWGKSLRIGKLGEVLYENQGGIIRKRSRGKRKRKDCNREVKEGSSGENNLSESANPSTVSQSKENSCCNSFEARESSDANEASRSSTMDGVDVLMALFNSVAEDKSASVFRRRLDSQRRSRYKKLIRQHLDIETIRSRVASHYITTKKELYRDLLLLANNALVFYSRNSREHQSAVSLRRLISSTFQKLMKSSSNMVAHNTPNQRTQTCDLIAKPRRSQPAKRNESQREANPGDVKTPNGNRRRRNNSSNPPSSLGLSKKETSTSTPKKAPGGIRKAVGGTSKSERSATGIRGRKRGRTK